MKFHTEDQQILGTTVQNSVSYDLWTPDLFLQTVSQNWFHVILYGRILKFFIPSEPFAGKIPSQNP